MSTDSATGPTGDVRHASGTIDVPAADLARGGPAHAVNHANDPADSKLSSRVRDPRHPSLYENPQPRDMGKPASHDLVRESLFDGIDGRLTRFLGADRAKVLGLLHTDLGDRVELGLERYGVTLQAGNGRDALIDLYQEAIDGLAYARTILDETDPASDAYAEIKGLFEHYLIGALKTRRILGVRNGELEHRAPEPKKPKAPAGQPAGGSSGGVTVDPEHTSGD